MKSFVQLVHDEVALEAIEKYANRIILRYEIAMKQEGKAKIGFEFAKGIAEEELERAREELK